MKKLSKIELNPEELIIIKGGADPFDNNDNEESEGGAGDCSECNSCCGSCDAINMSGNGQNRSVTIALPKKN